MILDDEFVGITASELSAVCGDGVDLLVWAERFVARTTSEKRVKGCFITITIFFTIFLKLVYLLLH